MFEAEVYLRQGLALYNKGDHGAATAEFREALRLKPDLDEARSGLEEAPAKKGKLRD